jgi:signal transduction histidine kinase/tetratricopeptide (TPR) repeat protein
MHQRRRIILLFGLGIVLPSLLLGYLAFRGIQNDRALVEKERLDATRRAADRVLRAVDDGISAIETALSKSEADQSGASSVNMAASLEKLADTSPLVEQIFYLRNFKDLRFPVAKAIYVPDGSRPVGSSPLGSASVSAELRAAERLEFQQKDYPQALASCGRILERSSDPHLSGLILNAMARIQKKSGLSREAISTYEKILRDHDGVVIAGGMPLGPSAALEIGTLADEVGDFAKSHQTSIGLYRSLLRGEWHLEKAEFEFFIERAKRPLEAYLASPQPDPDLAALRPELQALLDEEETTRKNTERMLLFQENAAPLLEAKIRAGGGGEASGLPFSRSTLDIGNESYLVAVEKPAARTVDASDEVWGAIFSPVRVREDILRPALQERFPSGETSWTVRGRDGAVIASSDISAAGPVAFRTNFTSGFPDWTLEFRQPPPRLIKTFLLSRRGLYSFALLLIAGILTFGLILTIRSVSHELELARMKSDFVSTVSHEFKSPLTSIRQLAEMLQSGRVPSEERRQRYYDVLLEQSERLALLTDNILSLAKIESGRAEFKFEPTDIAALLTEVVTSIQERVRHQGFAIGLEAGGALPVLEVDRTAFAQALTNLIDNAIKYSGDSRRISVLASSGAQTVVIAVRDFGIGIGKEDIEKVFERFYRAGDTLTRTVKGSGLGLTLVKEIVEAHGGKTSVESEPGKGSVFSVQLPIPQKERG